MYRSLSYLSATACLFTLGACDTVSGTDAGDPPDATPPPDDAAVVSSCGDGTVQPPERCDLGADNGGDTCAWDCTPAAPFVAYDATIEGLMDRFDIPGGAVAVMVQGRLVLVRGYGVMDREGTPTHPLARFRVASVSKPITAAAVLQLVEEGRLGLDDRVFEWLADLVPAVGTPERAAMDARIFDVTVRHLLHHSGGWDREAPGGYDPMFSPGRVSAALGVPSPPEADDIARYMTTQPLDFTPGERYAYSNFGYSLLGRVIERVAGAGYESHVREHLLLGIGIDGMAIGASRLGRVAADEPYYFPTVPGAEVRSVFDEDGNPQVPAAYGGWHHRSLDAHGGWVSNTLDLLRFSGAVDGFTSRPDVLDPAHLALLTERPARLWPSDTSPTYYYAMGWSVRVLSPMRQNRWHSGSLPGTSSILVRTADDVTWVALFNRRSSDPAWTAAMDAAMWDAARTVDAWPAYDLFDRYE